MHLKLGLMRVVNGGCLVKPFDWLLYSMGKYIIC